MQTVTPITVMQGRALDWRRRGKRVALVPTMGYLHAGHLSLIAFARQAVGPRGRVVVSLFVNPAQFGPGEDFTRYPRDLERDTRLCREAGVDVLFTPGADEMYAGGACSTFVVEERLSRGMEGASRPTHFRGVTTVVAKLFNLVLPDVAVFGAKDYQQAAIVRRMVRDLNFPLKVIVAPTIREADGLAMSSRNAYLTPEERTQATVLWRAIERVRAALGRKAQPVPAARLQREVQRLVADAPAARLDYVQFLDPETLAPVSKVKRGAHMALAVHIGRTRLIDNGRL